jgi:hypothetical protein
MNIHTINVEDNSNDLAKALRECFDTLISSMTTSSLKEKTGECK